MKTTGIFLGLLIILLAGFPVQAQEIHVPDDAESIGEAVAAANAGDVIIVADGQYEGQNNSDILVEVPLTIQSENGQNDCIISGVQDNPEYGIRAQAANVTIRGFTFVGFQRAVTFDNCDVVVVEDCFFTLNTIIALELSQCEEINVLRCDISENVNEQENMDAVGLRVNGCSGVIEECIFTENSCLGRGAAFYAGSSSLTVTNSDFVGNFSSSHGGAALITDGQEMLFEYCVFSGNSTIGDEQAGVNANGGAIALTSGNCNFNYCEITQNSTGYGSGGGIYCYNGPDGQCFITNTLFTHNESRRHGGGILIFNDASCDLTNCIFENNTSGIDGGGVSVSGSSTMNMTNCDIVNNEGGLESDRGMGGGIYMGSTTDPVVYNSIVFGNTSDIGVQIYPQNAAVVTLHNNLIEEGINPENDWIMDQLNEQNNIDEDPMFVEGRDPTWGPNGFFLDEDSPCIDAGNAQAADLGMDEMTTQVNLTLDEEAVDIGFHYNLDHFPFFGRLYGTVTDAADDAPLQGAFVRTSLGQQAVVNEEGGWEIAEALAGREFSITATFEGYNDSTLVELVLEEDEEMEINFGLLHPVFRVSHDAVEEQVDQGQPAIVEMTITNQGNAMLEWSAATGLADINVEPWGFSESINAGELAENNDLSGIAYGEGVFFVTGGEDDPNMVYVFSPEGQLLDEFDQFGDSRSGMEGLTFDGEFLWGAEENMIYGFTTDGALEHSFEGPFNIAKYVAWDPDREVLWIAYTTSDIAGFNRQGQRAIDNDLDRQDLRIYGLHYWSGDPDGHPLYILSKRVNDDAGYIYKMNPDNQDLVFVERIVLPSGEPNDCVICNAVDPLVMNFVTVGDASINDGGDRVDIFTIEANADWMSVEPAEGEVEPGAEAMLELTLFDEEFGAGVYNGQLTIDHNAEGAQVIIPITLTVGDGGDDNRERDLVVDFTAGWNLMSINVVPAQELWDGEEGPDVVLMLDQLRIDEDNHRVELFKDKTGRFYSPSWGFCNIPFWNLHQGYLCKMTEEAQTTWSGVSIPADAEIPLTEGWNITAYYPTYELSARAPDFYVVSNIIDELIIAKDVRGRFMSTEFNFSNMEPWQETQGYMIKVENDVILTYPEEQEEVAQSVRHNATETAVESPVNMSVLVSTVEGMNVQAGDEIRAFDFDGNLIGSGVVDETGRCGLAVWGDDEATQTVEGLISGQAFELRYVSNEDESVVELEVSQILEGGGLVYDANGFTVLEATTSANLPSEFYMAQSYPNPFNAVTKISYGLPEAARVQVNVFDMNGRQVMSLVNGEQQAGHHTLVLDGGEMASGLYMVKMQAGKFNAAQKVTLIK